MIDRNDPFNCSAEDITQIINDDMGVMDDLATDETRATVLSDKSSDQSSIFDYSRFHSVTDDELNSEIAEDSQIMDNLAIPNDPVIEILDDTKATMPPNFSVQATDTWNAYSMAQSLMEEYVFLLVDKAVYCYIDRAYVLLDDVSMDRLIFQHHKDAISMQGKTGIITEIRKFIKLGDVLDGVETDQEHIVFLNGRYNLAADCFEPNGADIFATSYLNFEYDQDDKGCENFKSFLKFVSGGNDSLKQLILEVMGYLLSCNNTAKKFFVLFGPGNTGKSLFLALMREFFPMQFVSTI